MSYTAAMAVALLVLGVGSLVAIIFVLFVPGYILVACLFPDGRRIDWIERIVVSFGLSIAVVPLLALILTLAPWGARFAPIVVTIAIFTLGVGYAAYWRRMRLPETNRLALTVHLGKPEWTEFSRVDKGLTIAVAVSTVIAAGSLAYVLITPRTGERFTQFYLLGPSGNASGYPTRLNTSEPGVIILGVVNHESSAVSYTIRVDLVGVQVIYNATSKLNETIEMNRTTRSWFNVTLPNGQNWTQPYSFPIDFPGLWSVQFLLYKDYDFSFAYRQLRLSIRVV